MFSETHMVFRKCPRLTSLCETLCDELYVADDATAKVP